MRYANQHTGTIVRYNGLPKNYADNTTGQLILGFQYSIEEDYQEQGFYELVEPVYDTDTQYLGAIYWVGLDEVFTYEVIDKTEEQLQEEALKASQTEQANLIVADQKLQSLISAQGYTDEEALNNQAMYPQWVFPYDYEVDYKVQDFEGIELKLYKALQPHTSQEDWQPHATPAIWLRIYPTGVIPIWVQPTGAHDAYNIGQQVHYPTETDPIYESTVDANIYAPLVVAGQWVEV